MDLEPALFFTAVTLNLTEPDVTARFKALYIKDIKSALPGTWHRLKAVILFFLLFLGGVGVGVSGWIGVAVMIVVGPVCPGQQLCLAQVQPVNVTCLPMTRSAGCEVVIDVREEHRTTTGYGIQVLVDTRVTKAPVKDLQKLGIVAKVQILSLPTATHFSCAGLIMPTPEPMHGCCRAARSCYGRVCPTPLLLRRTRFSSPTSLA